MKTNDTKKRMFGKIVKIALGLLMVLFSFSACTSDGGSDSPPDDGFEGGISKEITTNGGGELTSENGGLFVPEGAVSKKDDGSEGVIVFSQEVVSEDDLTIKIPDKYSLVGSVMKYGPSGFIFAQPITVYLSGKTLDNLEGIQIIWLDEKNEKWKILPITAINSEEKKLGVATFELGYFAVVRTSSTASSRASDNRRNGGIKMTYVHSEYYYTIRVVDFTPKYPDEEYEMKGATAHSGFFVGEPKPVYMIGIPQGEYVLEISRVRRGTPSRLPGAPEYCPEHKTVNVTGFKPTIASWDHDTRSPWAIVEPCPAGTMIKGIPPSFPKADKTYGTGQFQATLNWANNYGTTTDIDLAIRCPNGEIVDYDSPSNSDGSLQLDRDWRYKIGYATENIYSTKELPKGTYKVVVWLYDGHQKNYEVRILMGNKIKTFRGFLNMTGVEVTIYEFTIK